MQQPFQRQAQASSAAAQPPHVPSSSAIPFQSQAQAPSAAAPTVHTQPAATQQPSQQQAQTALAVVPLAPATRSSLARAAAAVEASQEIVPNSGQSASQELQPYNEPAGVESPRNHNIDSVLADMREQMREGESLVEAEDEEDPMDVDRKSSKRKRVPNSKMSKKK